MLITRFWGVAAVFLCTLLLQDCRPSSLGVAEEKGEEGPAVGTSASAAGQCVSSAPVAMHSLTPPGASPVASISPPYFSTTPANVQEEFSALTSRPLSPTALFVLATADNSPTASHAVQAAAMPRDSHVVPLSNNLGYAPSLDGPSVCLDKEGGDLREVPSGEEDAKPPAKRRSTNLDDALLQQAWQAQFQSNCEVDLVEAEHEKMLLRSEYNTLLPEHITLLHRSTVIGPKEWNDYFGEVGEAPPLPGDIEVILGSRCPFWPRKQVKDTHLLVLIPATVGGQPFTLDLLEVVTKVPKGGSNKTEYKYYNSAVKKTLGNQLPGSPYWVLMTRDVLPNSRSKTYDAQKQLIAKHANKLNLPYEMPHVLEAATVILLHHARTGERLYRDSPLTYTRCQEKVCNNTYPVFVGGFSSEGLVIDYSSPVNYNYYGRGASCLRKL